MAVSQLRHSKPSAAKPQSKGFRPDIQGLRALAVVAVIADHFLGWPTGGFVGVDVFFVISGFLITALLLREHERTGTISFTGFYLRRAKRIMPAALLVILATVGASYLLLNSTRFNATVWDGVWATLFGANWRFAILGTDYFQLGGAISPLQHYWSLAVEEQFYFVWPWLMLLIYWAINRKGGSAAGHARRIIGMAIILLTVASFVWSVWETNTNASVAYFSTFSRAWELGIGAAVAVYAPLISRIPVAIRHALSVLGLAGITVSIFVVTDTVAFPGPSAAFPVLAAALLIAGGTGVRRSFLWPLTNPVSRYVGDISYSLYLWHFPVTILLLSIYPGDSLEYVGVGVVAMLVLSVLSFHLVENPARHFELPTKSKRGSFGEVPTNRAKLVGLGLLSAVTAVVVVAALMPRESPASAVSIPLANSGGTSIAKVKCFGAASLDPKADCDRDLGSDITPSTRTFADDHGNSYDCFFGKDKPMKSCTYGEGTKRVALVGDSHAAALLPGLTEQAKAQNWQLDTYVGVGCLWSTSTCSAMTDIQTKLLGGRYDAVITTAYRGTGTESKEAQAEAFASQWRPVASNGSKVVVVEDVPNDVAPALECMQRVTFDVTNNNCNITQAAAFRIKDAASMAAALVPNTAVVSTVKYFCVADECPAVIGNVVVYRDGISHITGTYSKTLGPYIAKDISVAAGFTAP
ncbi:peptidoglycan/LPS O-acetylase OafA/YrhL [Arthrobacter sp. SORGH_AS 212]|uniref:acyltransferase family protein n=1 Tax=Pseudarthrobacter sp. SORGH_AS 212 TaxID=3041777 RepID=UPI002788A151|nr:peptidoglycan/LPS O-acetylase OafA/YrhL [Arthrobacter sp. SORGH_AS_0212]